MHPPVDFHYVERHGFHHPEVWVPGFQREIYPHNPCSKGYPSRMEQLPRLPLLEVSNQSPIAVS